MKLKMNIDVAKFSTNPAGRYRTDGDFSGEVFREDVLVPALRSSENITINLDGTEGYGSSFLEEAFGGMLRYHEFTKATFLARVSFLSAEDPTCIDEILGYLGDEERRQSHDHSKSK